MGVVKVVADVADAESLRKLLAHRRSLVQPEDVGLVARPEGGRGRPAPGLSQPDMDELLNRTAGSYARFERGVLKGVTRELIQQIAQILSFDEQTWQGLWVFLTGNKPPYPLDPKAGSVVACGWAKFLRGISYPAYITDQAANVLAFNDAFEWIFKDRIAPANTWRWMLLDPDGRRTLLDWKQSWAPVVLPQLRAAVAAFPDNETLQELDRDVRSDPVTGPMYIDVREAYVQPDGDVRRLFHWGLATAGWVEMRTAEPGGSPGARFMGLMFEPDHRGS